MHLLLEVAVEGVELALLHAVGAVGGALDVGLEGADLVADGGVLELGVGHEAVELALGLLVGAAEGALVQARDLLHVGRQRLNLVADVRHPLQEVLLREDVVGRDGAVGLHLVLFLDRGRGIVLVNWLSLCRNRVRARSWQ